MDNSPPSPSPPPPFQLPLLHSPKSSNFPVIAIVVIGILATAFLLISYYIFVIKCCLTWHRVDIFNRFFSRVRDPSDEDGVSIATNNLLNIGVEKKGLDEALIRSIPVIQFRKLADGRNLNDETLEAGGGSYECAVCLSEFEEGERLRVIPNCCHAFHIDCIDVWLQSNANCPLCRSAISPSSILYNHHHHLVQLPQKEEDNNGCGRDNNDNENDNDNDNDDDDYVVIEIEGNNLDEPTLVRREQSAEKKKLRHVWSIGDELIDMRRKKDEEFQNIQPIRRSISMDLSSDREFCLEIQRFSKSKEIEVSCSSGSSCNYSTKVRRSIFSFGYGRGSRCSVHLDP